DIDQLRIALVYGLVAKTQPVHGAGPEILDEHVHFFGQAQAELDALGVFQIDRNSVLAAIVPDEVRSLVADERWTPRAPHVPARRFHLVDRGPVKREEHGAVRPGQGMRKVQHPQAVEDGKSICWHHWPRRAFRMFRLANDVALDFAVT